MKDLSLLTYVKNNADDEYALNVLYYCIKKHIVEKDFSLNAISSLFIDGRYMGYAIKITSRAVYKSPLHAFAVLLSIRLLIINHKYIDLCYDENLIFVSKPTESFQWMDFTSLIMENWDDEEVKMLYLMMESFYYDDEINADDKESFIKSMVVPEFRKEKEFYQSLAKNTNGVSNGIIGNNAFVESDINQFTVTNDIVYVGNTAFAYCENLESLSFEGKVLFGIFPIVECLNLKSIIVPENLVDYYCQCLPYYNNIITGRVNYPINEIKEHNTIVESSIKDSTDVSSSLSSDNGNPDSSLDKAPAVSFEERKNQIEVNIFQSVFDKKASSYKYFWLMAIVSLAKDKGVLSISYQDIVIRMAAIAWPIVLDYEIDLGASDMMRKYLEDVIKNTTLIRQATSNVVEKYLSQHYSSQGIDKVLSP